MDDEDRRVLHEILGRGEGFGHRQHVELAWRLLATHGTDQAADAPSRRSGRSLPRTASPGTFHETITKSWVRCVAAHREHWPAATFAEFLDRNPRLLDPGLLGHFLLARAAGQPSGTRPVGHPRPASPSCPLRLSHRQTAARDVNCER